MTEHEIEMENVDSGYLVYTVAFLVAKTGKALFIELPFWMRRMPQRDPLENGSIDKLRASIVDDLSLIHI